jgi:hypothetical protein
MKRYIKNTIILSVAGALSFSCDSSNKTVDDVFDGVTRGAVFRAVSPATVVAAQEFSFSDPSSTYEVTFEVEDNAEGGLLQEVEVYSAFTDASDAAGSVEEVLVETLDPSMFTTNERGLPEITYSITLGELSSALGLVPEDYTGGDSFTIRYEIVLTDGRTFSNGNLNSTVSGGSYYRSPFIYTVPLVCPPIPPTSGVWTIQMQDSYGDGWQTDNGDGGSGLTVTLNDGTIFEVGLCSPYLASDFDCTSGVSSGSATIEIPEGTTSAEWVFPGDFWGEITFQIITPNGNVVADIGLGAPAGAVAIDFCLD